MAEIKIRPRARRDLAAIWGYTVEIWPEAQADKDLRELTTRFEALADHPELGRKCDAIRSGYRVYPSGKHLIFFKPTANGIDVIRVLHQRMDATSASRRRSCSGRWSRSE